MSVQPISRVSPISSTFAYGSQSSDPGLSQTSSSADHVETRTPIRSSSEIKELKEHGIPLSIGEEQLFRAIERAAKALEGPSTQFEVKFHEQTKSIIVKVLNKETGELIREIPPEKTLDLVVKMMEIAGILIDERV